MLCIADGALASCLCVQTGLFEQSEMVQLSGGQCVVITCS
jgi:hypothetical protein